MSNQNKDRAGDTAQGVAKQAGSWGTGFQNQVQGMMPDAAAKANEAYGGASKAFGSFTGSAGAEDPTQVAAIRQGYGNLATTGGFTPQQSSQFIRQATSGVPQTYNVLQQQLARSRSTTGGFTPGGETAQLARHAVQDQATATTGAEAELAAQKRQGVVAGLGGMKDLESGLANQKIQAAGGLANLYSASPGYVIDLLKSAIGGEATSTAAQNNAAEIMQQLAAQPGLWQKIISSVAQLGGAAGGIMTGTAAMQGKVSDRWVKSNIKTIAYLGPVRFVTYIRNFKNEIGVIAQEVREIFPQVVQKLHGVYHVDYGLLFKLLGESHG